MFLLSLQNPRQKICLIFECIQHNNDNQNNILIIKKNSRIKSNPEEMPKRLFADYSDSEQPHHKTQQPDNILASFTSLQTTKSTQVNHSNPPTYQLPFLNKSTNLSNKSEAPVFPLYPAPSASISKSPNSKRSPASASTSHRTIPQQTSLAANRTSSSS